jgi:hypothetical protein
MRTVSRGGTTLVELAVVLSAAGLLAALVMPVLMAGGRAVVISARRLAAERDATTVGALLSVAFRPSTTVDLSIAAGDALGFDRQVGRAVVCGAGTSSSTIGRRDWVGVREPVPGRDEVLLLSVDSLTWSRAVLVALRSVSCSGTEPAWILEFDRPVSPAARVRVVEPSRLRAYRSGSSWWLGLERRRGGGAIQPLGGPFPARPLTVVADSGSGLVTVVLRWQPLVPPLRLVSRLEPAR